MPEGYTHIRTGEKALRRAGLTVADRAAFAAGANGPDPFFCYKIWVKGRTPDLPGLGSRMHKEHTGAFLNALVTLAKTPAQQAYSLGFLTHYATDQLVHPYVFFLTDPEDGPYHIPAGHGFYEIGLDSQLYEEDHGTDLVPADATAPPLSPQALHEIALLLREALSISFGEDIPLQALEDTFRHTRFLRKFFVSRFGFKRGLAKFLEKAMFHDPGFILSHMQPAKFPQGLPPRWKNLFTGETVEGGVRELLEKAKELGAEYLQTADAYWAGLIPAETVANTLGSQSYETGLPVD